MSWLPYQLMRRSIRQRCDDLGIAMPEKREENSTSRQVYGGILAACLVAAVALFIPGESDPLLPLRLIGMLLAVVVFILSIRFAGMKRQQYGLYFGTMARSLAPVYAFSIILLTLTAQPWLLYNEAQWLRQDTLTYGYIAQVTDKDAGENPIEACSAQRLAGLLQQALENETPTRK